MMTKILFRTVLFASVVLWVTTGPAVAKVLCEGSEAFMGLGTTPHKQCISEHIPEFSDYENIFEECKLIVYLTDLTNKDAAQEKLEAAYRQAARHVKSCWAGREPILEFRLAKYSYPSYAAWKRVADEELRDELGGDQRGVVFLNQKISIFVVTDAAMAKAIEFLAEHGVPEDAFEIDSREAEIRRQPSIAPIVRATDQGEQYLLPAFYASGEKRGELILGQTTMDEAVRMLPPWPGHEPSQEAPAPRSERSPRISEDIHGALDKIAYVYHPAYVIYLMITFDKSERLISAHYQVQEGQAESLLDALSNISSLKLVHSEEGRSVHRGQIGSCITVEAYMAQMPDGNHRITNANYFYTCDL